MLAKRRLWKSKAAQRRSREARRLLSYAYRPLEGSDIRLLILHPGSFDDSIRITILHTPLTVPERTPQPERLSAAELSSTLPAGWTAYETHEGRYLFYNAGGDGTIQYDHPIPGFNVKQYAPLARYPPLSYEPRFDALSYVWGPEQHPESILICLEDNSSRSLQVRSNLAAALRHLRKVNDSRALWIDAICINQNDDIERSKQVPRMRYIYSLADTVVAWMGPDTDDCEATLQGLHRVGQELELTKSNVQFASPSSQHDDWDQIEASLASTEREWRSIGMLYDRPLFKRVWILQELLLGASRAILQCAHSCAELYAFRRATRLIQDLNQTEHSIPASLWRLISGVSRVADLLETRRDMRSLMLQSHGLHCSLAQDKIYGILSLAPPRLADLMAADYQRPAMEIYRDTQVQLLNSTGRFDLLIDHNPTMNLLTGPSWIRDLSRPDAKFVPSLEYALAASYSRADYTFPAPSEIWALGVGIGEVLTVSETIGFGSEDTATLQACQPADLLTSTYPNGEPSLDAYLTTLQTGLIKELYLEDTSDASLQSIKEEFLTDPASASHPDTLYRLSSEVCFFQTAEGWFGIGSDEVRRGDFACVLLGCSNPLILRPETSGRFRSVGTCYVHGFMNGECLLGRPPRPWVVKRTQDELGYWVPRYVNTETGEIRSSDPRLPPLPAEWESIGHERTDEDPLHFSYHRNRETGRVLNSDPRLLPEALRERGIKLETFKLV